MKYLVKMMIPWETTIEAESIREAGAAATRLRDTRNDPEGNHTVTLLSVTPVIGAQTEETQT